MLRFVRLFSIPALALLATLSFSTPALADDCQPMFDAGIKFLTVPAHSYTTETANGKTRTSEAIHINGAIYINLKDKWIRSKATTQDMLKQEQENIRDSKTTCRHVREESVNGEAAALYMAHSENDDVKSDAQTWISKSKGLPLRTGEDIDTGGGDKRHMSIRYEYGNIQAPAVMQ
jgi:hypothetical protein